MAAPTSATRSANKLSGRDLINVGIFTAIYFVIMFGFGMLGSLGPFMSGLAFLLGILANGTVIALYLSRVHKLGSMTLLGLIVSCLMVATGHPWFTILTTTALGACADLIANAGHFAKARLNIVAYAVFCLWYVGPIMPVVWDTAGYRQYVTDSMNAEYADGWMRIFSPSTLPLWGLAFFAAGLIGGWFGQSVLRRQFRRAGVA
ncbi:MAG: MptD family putative ECF transporter S component [Actinomycetaceae bacterium]|nr:MptD family putative ECF transporter S component [Actinomycetaceae bacterium]